MDDTRNQAAPAVDEDPVKQEIDRLKARLAGGMVELHTVSDATIDESEKIARYARRSRPSMRALTQQPAQPIEPVGRARERLATPSPGTPPGDLTKKFRALR